MAPFLPFSAEKLWRMLNAPGVLRDMKWDAIPTLRLPDGHALGKRGIQFNKIADGIIEAQIAKLHSLPEP
jgi:methionyl-tRNA synthetase